MAGDHPEGAPVTREFKGAHGAPRASYAAHAAHGPWRQVDRCVYCACGTRLYQGRLPKDQQEMARQLDELDARVRARRVAAPGAP